MEKYGYDPEWVFSILYWIIGIAMFWMGFYFGRKFKNIEKEQYTKNKNKINIKNIEEIPNNYLTLLYDLRFDSEEDINFEDYIKRFEFIVIDNSIYYKKNEYNEKVLKRYLNSDEYTRARFPNVIIIGGKVIKNRYGSYNL